MTLVAIAWQAFGSRELTEARIRDDLGKTKLHLTEERAPRGYGKISDYAGFARGLGAPTLCGLYVPPNEDLMGVWIEAPGEVTCKRCAKAKP